MKTRGISPKLYVPLLAEVLAIFVHWIATGEFDRVEVAASVFTAGQATLAWIAGPGDVVVEGTRDANGRRLGEEGHGDPLYLLCVAIAIVALVLLLAWLF